MRVWLAVLGLLVACRGVVVSPPDETPVIDDTTMQATDCAVACDAHASCVEGPTGYACVCQAGFSGDGQTCTDIDECQTGAVVCDANATCTNTAGAATCSCGAGFAGDGTTCSDVDECLTGLHDCSANATCLNGTGGFTCACLDGYDGDGQSCSDINECDLGLDDCDSNAACNNVDGSFACDCNSGYDGDGKTCVDIDECTAGTHTCDLNAKCTNTVGSYTCSCRPGFVGTGNACYALELGRAAFQIRPGGALYSWGPNGSADTLSGLLGQGNQSDYVVWSPQAVDANAWKQVSTMHNHACAIRADDTLHCWGDNASKQLGHTDPDHFVPHQVGPSEARWSAVAAGSEHTCAIRKDEPFAKTLWCWGADYDGALGRGASGALEPAPIKIGDGVDWEGIAAGWRFTCGIRNGGELWCWGSNTSGQVGINTAGADVTTTTKIDGFDDWIQLSLGYEHTCARRATGELYCWGSAAGNFAGNQRTTPTAVDSAVTWTDVAAYNSYTCALKAGAALCTGGNEYGPFGNGTTTGQNTGSVSGPPGSWLTLAAGWDFGCGIAQQGAVFTTSCWGQGAFGAMGDGVVRSGPTALRVGDENNWVQVSAKTTGACGIQQGSGTRTASCWGLGGSGSYGAARQVPVQVGSDTDWVALGDLGTASHFLGLRGSAAPASLYSFGYDVRGSLGRSTAIIDAWTPGQVGSLSVLSAAAGGYTSAAILSDNTLFTWGSNEYGVLGQNIAADTNAHATPAVVSGGGKYASVSVGYLHMCAVGADTNAGKLYCWGNGWYGALGLGPMGMYLHYNTPQLLGGTADWTSVSLGSFCGCGLRNTGEAWCWGNFYGTTASPSKVTGVDGGDDNWTALKLGTAHACGIKNSGEMFCWGKPYRQPSFGNAPTRFGDALWSSVSSGETLTCGIQTDGSLWCWGDNTYGQLGNGLAWVLSPVPLAN